MTWRPNHSRSQTTSPALAPASDMLETHAATFQLPPHPGRGHKDQVGMIEGVVANGVAGSLDRANNLRPLADVLSNQKKSGFGPMFGQQIEQMESMRIIGAIVKCQSHLSRIPPVGKCAAVELRMRRHGGISRIRRSRRCRQTCKSQKHLGEVSW